MIPAEGPDRARLHSQVSDVINVSDHIVDAQGRIVNVFERFRELLPECNGQPATNFVPISRSRQIKIGPLARSDRKIPSVLREIPGKK